MGFSRQEYWSGVPFSCPWDLPDPGIKLGSPASLALAGGLFTTALNKQARSPEEKYYQWPMALVPGF